MFFNNRLTKPGQIAFLYEQTLFLLAYNIENGEFERQLADRRDADIVECTQ